MARRPPWGACPLQLPFPVLEPPAAHSPGTSQSPHAMAGRTQPHADWKVPVLTLGSKRASPIPRAKPQQLLTVPGADWKAPPLVTKVRIHVETSSPKVRFARAVVWRVTARSDGPSTGSLRVKRVAKGEVGFESYFSPFPRRVVFLNAHVSAAYESETDVLTCSSRGASTTQPKATPACRRRRRPLPAPCAGSQLSGRLLCLPIQPNHHRGAGRI